VSNCLYDAQDAQGPPDVWLQIAEHCADNNTLMRQFTRGLGQLLAQQEQHFTARIIDLQQQHTTMQQQAAAATAAAAAFEGRLQALDRQVQQMTQALQARQTNDA
jgi:hypothetical protein